MMDNDINNSDQPRNLIIDSNSQISLIPQFSNSQNNQQKQKNTQKNYNNNKNQKNDFSYFSSSFHSHSNINFTTLNLQGSFEIKKRELISYMIQTDTHFLLLTETHLKDPKNDSTKRLIPIKLTYPTKNRDNANFYIIHN